MDRFDRLVDLLTLTGEKGKLPIVMALASVVPAQQMVSYILQNHCWKAISKFGKSYKMTECLVSPRNSQQSVNSSRLVHIQVCLDSLEFCGRAIHENFCTHTVVRTNVLYALFVHMETAKASHICKDKCNILLKSVLEFKCPRFCISGWTGSCSGHAVWWQADSATTAE